MKITKHQKYWLNKISKNGGLIKYYNLQDNMDFEVMQSKEKIRKTMALKLIDKGMLIPAGDGLFGDTQTYKAAEDF